MPQSNSCGRCSTARTSTATGAVEFFGANLTLPPEARFASVDSVQRYVDDVLAHPAVRRRWPAAEPLTVRARRGTPRPTTSTTGRSPPSRSRTATPRGRCGNWWCCTRSPTTCADADPPHGPEFVATFCELAEAVMGPEVGHVLRVVYAKEGVR